MEKNPVIKDSILMGKFGWLNPTHLFICYNLAPLCANGRGMNARTVF